METACHEMENYSGFTELGKKVYKRYQNRPEQKTPLKLSNFGWNVDDQVYSWSRSTTNGWRSI